MIQGKCYVQLTLCRRWTAKRSLYTLTRINISLKASRLETDCQVDDGEVLNQMKKVLTLLNTEFQVIVAKVDQTLVEMHCLL